jgi:hypothetical protein
VSTVHEHSVGAVRYEYSVSAVQYEYSISAVRVQYQCSISTVRVQHQYSTSTVRVQYEYSISIVSTVSVPLITGANGPYSSGEYTRFQSTEACTASLVEASAPYLV